NSRRADYQPGHETTSDPRGTRQQPSAVAVNAGSVRGYVYQQKDEHFAGLRPLAPLRCLCAADLRTLSLVARCGSADVACSLPDGSTLHVSLHDNGVRSFLGDLKS